MVCEADKECQRHGFVSVQERRTNGLRSRQEVPKARIRERAKEKQATPQGAFYKERSRT